MTDIERIPRITGLLAETWKKHPDWRLTELLIELAGKSGLCDSGRRLNDEEFEHRLRELLDGENESRQSGGERILFYRVADEYGDFSNFADCPVMIDGKTWPTSEHYFQAQKFENAEYREKIRHEKSPMIAARLGRSRKHKLRRDWESVKDNVMRKALHAKFTQHENLREMLLDTGGAEIVEHTSKDKYWGDGGDGRGRNMLGRLLMELRSELAMIGNG